MFWVFWGCFVCWGSFLSEVTLYSTKGLPQQDLLVLLLYNKMDVQAISYYILKTSRPIVQQGAYA